jgi:hypothetical protein
MVEFIFILKFFGGILLVFAAGGVAGHLLKLDKYLEEIQNDSNERIKATNKKVGIPTRKISPKRNPPAGGRRLATPVFDYMQPLKNKIKSASIKINKQ